MMDVVKRTVTLSVALDDADLIAFVEKQPDFEAWVRHQISSEIEKDKFRAMGFQKAERMFIEDCESSDHSYLVYCFIVCVFLLVCLDGIL